MRISASLVVLLAMLGCACGSSQSPYQRELSRPERAALTRGRAELGCTADVAVEPLGAGGYRVTGCGQQITFTCIEMPVNGRIVCSPSERGAVAVEADRDASWSDAEVQAYAASVRPELEGCLEAGQEASLELLAGGSGSVRRVADLEGSESEACIDAVLARSTLTGTRASPRRFGLRVRGTRVSGQ